MMKITGLSHLFKWENLHNWWLTKYFFAPLYIYIYIYTYTQTYIYIYIYIYIHTHKHIYIYISGGPLSALTCCVNVRLLSAIKKISPLIYSQSWVGSWVYTTQAMMTFTLIF